MASNNRGFFLFAKSIITEFGMNVKVVNTLTGAEVRVFENGIGGLAADMKNNSFNAVYIWNAEGGMGYHISVGFNQTSAPYNYFAIDGNGKAV